MRGVEALLQGGPSFATAALSLSSMPPPMLLLLPLLLLPLLLLMLPLLLMLTLAYRPLCRFLSTEQRFPSVSLLLIVAIHI
jgi:hypothetical protein